VIQDQMASELTDRQLCVHTGHWLKNAAEWPLATSDQIEASRSEVAVLSMTMS